MDKKRFIIISQTIFPAQFPRSLRATELAKELASQGHEVILYANLGKYNYDQFELENKLRVRNIGKTWFSKTNCDESFEINLLDRVLSKIFGKILEFPDIELMFKVPSIIKKEGQIDCLITIAIPFPLHWGAALSKSIDHKNFPKIWIADCGDPYMGNKFRKPYFYFKYLEKWFCKKANYITIPIEDAKGGYYKEFHDKVHVIPQGFNFDDIPICKEETKNNLPTFAYAGTFYKDIRDPKLFLEYITSLDQKFKFIIFSPNKLFLQSFKEIFDNRIEVRPVIPRQELLRYLIKVDFVVNFENETNFHSPSKLIDYALISKPILSVRSKHLEKNKINEFLAGKYDNQFIVNDLERYNIKTVAQKFIELANENNLES